MLGKYAAAYGQGYMHCHCVFNCRRNPSSRSRYMFLNVWPLPISMFLFFFVFFVTLDNGRTSTE